MGSRDASVARRSRSTGRSRASSGSSGSSSTLESAHVRFEVRENLKQPLGLMHGGIYSAVAETVASVATVNNVWRDGYVGSGLSNYASFLRPITDGTVDVRRHAARPRRPRVDVGPRVPRRARERCARSST